MKSSISLGAKMKKTAKSGRDKHQMILSPALKPSRIRSFFFAPRFCEVKVVIPLPIVVNEVITRLFSLIPALYPAITAGPQRLITF